MRKLIQQLCTLLSDGADLVLVTVSSQSGSTPRLAGAKMIVRRDGGIIGTIGGGMVEALAIKEADKCFADAHGTRRSFDLTNDDATITDMICGGKLELFLEFIRANDANRTVFQSLNAAMALGHRITLISPLDADSGDQRFVIDHKGRASRDDVPAQLLAAVNQIRSSTSDCTLIEYAGREYLASYFAVGGNLFLIGSGHVAACTAEAAARVGFRVIVMDDRSDFANRERFPQADEIKVLPSFAECFKEYDIDEDCYLVIVTRGHMHDMEVLDQALGTKAGYIGMIGSRKKRSAIYANLIKKGVKEAQLEQVHCPIGMAIKADTPEEIAVSIVGELIFQRATGRKA
ncbi:XdhC family protein [Desulfopila sp. IMCC35006]|uniref:XdhC family aldehyde oxidoreductase maturation factor n=1 Tax=Desulfopila sp. IMCC35006 TaxID=2569542 RepID=UPI0010AB615F|nr:XdhC/CoxI family protein [Desulfopila sp. IMCC35006]TKB25205.1 XdhC family protein [Desulfopila sp. IMCC35006]